MNLLDLARSTRTAARAESDETNEIYASPEGVPRNLLRFAPARRRRTEQRLAGRRCETCRGSWWRVHPNGDAECETCRRSRSATAETRTNSVPGAAS